MNRNKHPPNSENHPLIHMNPHDLVPFLEIKLYVDNQTPDIESFHTAPRLFATHMPYHSLPESIHKTRACKIVYLCRNPKDVLVSIWHFTNRLRSQGMGTNSLAHVFDQFRNGVSLFGPIWDHVLEYWNQSKEDADKIFFLKFEDLKRDPGFYLRRLAEFLECPFSAEEEGIGMVEQISQVCTFESLSGLEINQNGKLSSGEENKAFFRRGEVGDWKNYLTDEMVHKLDEIIEKKFGGSELVF
ncbi:cytosolic sulfotransferase 5-like [Henckelia pumila]|uniref:cytosolic sulfotransferase 5-like n=1 Tax=Henckelia pumila TaxID=405737 RepID=UPI003C6DE4EA